MSDTADTGAGARTHIHWGGVALGAGLVLTGILGFFAIGRSAIGQSIALETVGILLLLSISLGGLIVMAHALGSSTQQDALGLPAGSVRALLAFSLVIAFIAVASWALGDHPPSRSAAVARDVAEADISARTEALQRLYPPPRYSVVITPATEPNSKPATKTADIHVYDTAAQQQQDDMQKQIVTVLATVLVAVVGFYFGGKSSTEGVIVARDAMTQMHDRAIASTAQPPSPAPPTLADLDALVTQISALAEAAAAHRKNLGPAPDDDLKAAVAGTTNESLNLEAAKAQEALAALKTAAAAARAEADKSLATRNSVGGSSTPDPMALRQAAETLSQSLAAASQAKQAADAALATFTESRTKIANATAQG